MSKAPLFIYDDMPKMMKKYLSNFGWRFNKAACKDAVSMMRRYDNSSGKKVRPKTFEKEQVDDILKRNNVDIEHKGLYNYVYAYNMIMSDYMGNGVDDEKHAAQLLKGIMDDPDNPGGNVFAHWYFDQMMKGEGVDFEDYLDGED